MSGEKLADRFSRNASGILTQDDVDKAARATLNLEELSDVCQVTKFAYIDI
jgi:hypothetical protein